MEYEFGTVGKPFGDVDIKFGEDGEILIKSQKVMKEYFNRPEETAKVMIDGYFATGDIGELTKDGFLKITDRKKDLIKTAGGKYVAPQKLEGLLKLNKYISQVLIHGDQRKYIVAIVTLDQQSIEEFAKDQQISFQDLNSLAQNNKVQQLVRDAVAEVNTQLASFESIKNFYILGHDFTLESGELTPSLKVKRKFCDQKYRNIIDNLYGVDRGSI
ncbi:MAG: AMP-binding protein [Bdellovibrionales bacterium]|nr:AMP-binding protein [Bdellovibrionales bacterium]